MAEVGIDISDRDPPKLLTDGASQASDVVITMGCGDACPFFPGKRYEDWALDDPAGKDVGRGPRRSATTSTSGSGGSSPTSPPEALRR